MTESCKDTKKVGENQKNLRKAAEYREKNIWPETGKCHFLVSETWKNWTELAESRKLEMHKTL